MVLLKETSLVSVITLPDIMFITTRANVATKEPFLFFGAAMLIYLAFSLVSAWGLGRLEARANRGFAAFGGATR
jgi:polar amino acid transport system permease protein